MLSTFMFGMGGGLSFVFSLTWRESQRKSGVLVVKPKNLIWTQITQVNADFSDTCIFLPCTRQVRFYKRRAAEKDLCNPSFIRAICVNN